VLRVKNLSDPNTSLVKSPAFLMAHISKEFLLGPSKSFPQIQYNPKSWGPLFLKEIRIPKVPSYPKKFKNPVIFWGLHLGTPAWNSLPHLDTPTRVLPTVNKSLSV